MRLVCVSQFLRQFRLVVRHKSGKKNIISNALSRLVSTNIDSLIDNSTSYLKLDTLFIYSTMLVEINPN